METAFAIGFQILAWVVIIVAFIYLIARRINIKETEDFEKRDN